MSNILSQKLNSIIIIWRRIVWNFAKTSFFVCRRRFIVVIYSNCLESKIKYFEFWKTFRKWKRRIRPSDDNNWGGRKIKKEKQKNWNFNVTLSNKFLSIFRYRSKSGTYQYLTIIYTHSSNGITDKITPNIEQGHSPKLNEMKRKGKLIIFSFWCPLPMIHLHLDISNGYWWANLNIKKFLLALGAKWTAGGHYTLFIYEFLSRLSCSYIFRGRRRQMKVFLLVFGCVPFEQFKQWSFFLFFFFRMERKTKVTQRHTAIPTNDQMDVHVIIHFRMSEYRLRYTWTPSSELRPYDVNLFLKLNQLMHRVIQWLRNIKKIFFFLNHKICNHVHYVMLILTLNSLTHSHKNTRTHHNTFLCTTTEVYNERRIYRSHRWGKPIRHTIIALRS